MDLTPAFFPHLVEELLALAGRVCRGRLVVISMGGARSDLARLIVPAVVEVLVCGIGVAKKKERQAAAQVVIDP